MQLQDGENFGSNALVARFMKGVFIQRPALPRYKEIWDVSAVLKYGLCKMQVKFLQVTARAKGS